MSVDRMSIEEKRVRGMQFFYDLYWKEEDLESRKAIVRILEAGLRLREQRGEGAR